MFNPVLASKNIKEEFKSYIETSFSFADQDLRKQFDVELDKIISTGPWLEINDVFKSGKSINNLIDDGILSPLFRELESRKPKTNLYKPVLPLDRPLYLHQQNAIETIVSSENAVVSTGTGSGKTNCFLIPVINELLREKEAGTLGPGVRALFIYPMNALANDQIKNLRKILMFYPDITFGVYNGGTENDEDDAKVLYEAMFATETVPELRKGLPNEMLSRDKMKDNPPNILFTNYAMLEHLLFRPNDDVLFSDSDFRFVVLDEAHVYSGATGIETSILLRRLRARITSKAATQFILTSATLGNGENSDPDIVTFARNLCGVDFEKDNIIRAKREIYRLSPGEDYSDELIIKLADEKNIVADVLSNYGFHVDKTKPEAELIYDFVKSSNLYQMLRSKSKKVTSIDEIKNILNTTMDVTVAFISLCTRAQKNGRLLIDARYHFFLRSLEGCYIAFKDKKLFLNRQKSFFSGNKQYAVFEIAICDECGKIALVGKIDGDHLVQSSKLDEKINYFYFASEENDDTDEEEFELETGKKDKTERYFLCPHCGAIVPEDMIKNKPCDCNSSDYILIVKSKTLALGGRCGNCHRGIYKRLYLGNDAATSVLATSLYEELPELTYESNAVEPIKTTNIFIKTAQATKKKTKVTGRQFLAFSDSRQEAAKFACYLEKSYEEFLRRRGIYQVVKQQESEILNFGYDISDFVKKLTSYFSGKRSFARSNSDNSNLTTVSYENAWVAMLNELVRYNSSTSLTSLGVLQFEYLGNSDEIISGIAEKYNISFEESKNLLNLLIFEIVKMGAIITDKPDDISDDDREYIFFSPSQRFVASLQISEKKKTTIREWDVRTKKGKDDEYNHPMRLNYVKEFLGVDDKEAAEFLSEYFDYLIDQKNAYGFVDINKDGTYAMPARNFKVRIAGDQMSHWYRCKKCGKISQFNIKGRCSMNRCDGEVEEVSPEELSSNNHFAKLYFSDRMSPLFIKEHTAQLSKKEGTEYQEQFIKKEINALSCSTTFEMGVDVGDLETVFLRDVPPLPSNYAQRAGRAGRSVNAAAFALTFAKLSSHDLSFFNEPEKMINGTILPPLFKVDNEKIVKRHIYAVALSMFFKHNPDQYSNNNANKFINDKGYLDFYEWLAEKPERLKDMLKRSIPNIDNLHQRMGIDDFSWVEGFNGQEGVFSSLIREYEGNIAQFEKMIKNYKKENDLDKASKCQKKLENYKNNKIIDFLARGNVLPRYGFPVDTVELEQNTTASNINKLRLSRDLSVAIAEYATSSEVIADGKLYTSRYIRKSNIGSDNKLEWYTAYIGICPNHDCGAVNCSVTPIGKEGVPCVSCGEMLYERNFYESIEPRSGFVTERIAKPVPLSRQEKNYRSEDYYIGNTESKTIDKRRFKYNGIEITVESTTNDSLLVKSSNTFYVCPKCGFVYASDENIPCDKKNKEAVKRGATKIEVQEKHESLYGEYDCSCTELKKYSLHHTFNTDVAKITFGCNTSDKKQMLSTMYAILYTMADSLNIERRDIKACLSMKIVDGNTNYSIIIYDAVPGGAGHSRRLVTEDGEMLYWIMMKALNNMKSCNCNPSCYNCLRSYENQKIHDELDRYLAIRFLEQFEGDIEVIKEEKKV